MRFALTPEQQEFRETARRFLAERVDLRALIALRGAHDPNLWKSIAGLGWLGDEDLTFVETTLLAEEAGRALLPGPFLGTLIASEALRAAGSPEQRRRLLPAFASGEKKASVALDPGAVRFVRNRVRGELPAVPCAEVADVFLVLAAAPDGPALLLVSASEAIVETAAGADLTRPVARVRFEGAKVAERLSAEKLERVGDRARVLVAADAVGGAAKALGMAVDYAKEREQFDRPIGSFQAVKHRAADAWRAVEAARLAVWYAAWAIANDDEDASMASRAAKAVAGDAFVRAAADSIQIHGGIGFTWEHDAHLFYRRALADQAMLGDASEQRDAIAAGVLARG